MPETPPRAVFAGLATLDIVYGLASLPRPNTKNVVSNQGIFAGGPATNAAVAYRALGGEALLFTAVGRHGLGDLIRADLRTHGVSVVDLIPDHEGLPSLASVLVSPGGDRLAASTAANLLPAIDRDFQLIDPAQPPTTLLVDGHILELCVEAARQARATGVPVVLDAGSWKPGLESLLVLTDIAICAEDFRPPGCESSDDVFSFVRALGPVRNAITRGEKPILVDDDGRRAEVHVEPVDAVDTLGAGDIFHGAFCYYYATTNGDFRRSLESAGRVAGLSCRSFGTRSWIQRLPAATSNA